MKPIFKAKPKIASVFMRRRGHECAVFLLAAMLAGAQDLDTALFRGSASQLTILSQVKDAAEASAFEAAYRETDPTRRHTMARAFTQRYPQSNLLAQAFDAAAKASIDQGNYETAFEEARFSLRLLPENPTLLVVLANAEAHDHKTADAIRHAQDAISYLDYFDRPGAISEPDWKRLQPQLKASAWFALGLAQADAGLKQASRTDLERASVSLENAASCNAQDRETFYLRGVVRSALGDKGQGAADLAFAASTSDALGARALNLFHKAYPHADPALQSKPVVDPELCAPAKRGSSSAAIKAGYAGPESCRPCHLKEFTTWSQTGMARMLRPYEPGNLIAPFKDFLFEDSVGGAVRVGQSARPYFEVRDDSGQFQRFRVDYTIGSKWQQAFATALPDGRLQVLPIQYNRLLARWVNYWSVIDPAGSPRDVISRFPKLLPEVNYQRNCAVCHTSQLRASETSSDPMQHATFLQPGIDCEMCHGPSALHVQQAKAGRLTKLDFPLDLRQIDSRAGVRVCAQCHRQSAVREIGTNNELNYSASSEHFVPRSSALPYDAFSRRAFYKDGRFRETTFIVEAFTRSACYRRGTAQCASCHSPHLPDFANNLTSLKAKAAPNEMCLSCHSEYRARVAEHTHHAAPSEASECVACHMPRIANALLFQARSHQIEIPTADLTERFGQAESPNACLACHKDKAPGWASAQLTGWKRSER